MESLSDSDKEAALYLAADKEDHWIEYQWYTVLYLDIQAVTLHKENLFFITCIDKEITHMILYIHTYIHTWACSLVGKEFSMTKEFFS